MNCLNAALQVVDSRLGLGAQAALTSFIKASPETAVTLLINDIVSHTAPDTILTLVLDDFHWIRSAAIHQSLNFLLQHQPPQVHMLILTRADPPLSLARLRVEGRLVELRAADLCLTKSEMAAFLNDVMELDIQEEALGLLTARTEGWIAGLQLAALSLSQNNTAETVRLLETFAGARQHVFAYLLEEVLSRQPIEVRQFLQQTAVLRHFCASLCTAVTGQANVADLLQHLTAENLFITPLDDEGQWYRYHPLFAEMLQANLDHAVKSACCRRAAQWYADRQLVQEAIRYALAAQDYTFMANLLNQNYKSFLGSGLLVSLQKWLAYLPAEYQSPQLRLAVAWCRVYESSELELQKLVSAIKEQFPDIDEWFQGEVLAVQAIYASLYGQLDNAVQWATQALKLIDVQDFLSLAAAYQALGNAYRFQGELNAALAAYTQAQQQFEAMGGVFMGQLPLLICFKMLFTILKDPVAFAW